MPDASTASFIAFLEQLLVEQYPHDAVVWVLDNASYHISATSLAALSLFEPRVWVFWLPASCPTLNPIELFWRHLKDQACANKLFPNMPDLIATVERHLRAQSDLHNVIFRIICREIFTATCRTHGVHPGLITGF